MKVTQASWVTLTTKRVLEACPMPDVHKDHLRQLLTTRRVALYMRVSTEEQALEGYSLPEQLRDLRRYAEEKGWQIVAEETDDGYMGRSLRGPALRNVQALAEAGDIDAVVVKKWNRLARKGASRICS